MLQLLLVRIRISQTMLNHHATIAAKIHPEINNSYKYSYSCLCLSLDQWAWLAGLDVLILTQSLVRCVRLCVGDGWGGRAVAKLNPQKQIPDRNSYLL